MAIAYDWIIQQLAVKPHQGDLSEVVVLVNWRLRATQGSFVADAYGQVALGPPSPASYTPYAELTEDMVVEWVQSELGEESVAAMDLSLAGQIERMENPPIITPALPWQV
jgi:hypothetical protein